MQDAPCEIVRELGHGGMGLVYEVRLPRVLIRHGQRLLAAGRQREALAVAERVTLPPQEGMAMPPLSSWYKELDDLRRKVAGGSE